MKMKNRRNDKCILGILMNNGIHNFIALVILITVLLNCQGNQNIYYQNLQSLVEAERSFARLSADTGMKTAFMTWLADDAIVFRPEPVRGRERYANSPDIPGMLIWQPVYADISAAGDLGYTSGPYEYRQEGANHPADGYGHYVSIWKKQLDGSWKVLIDVGISHSTFDYDLRNTTLAVSNPKPKSITSASAYTFSLSQLDVAFSNTARAAGYHKALKEHSSSAVRIYREKDFPFIGTDAAEEEIKGTSDWSPISSEVSKSGDLGYTYGIAGARDTTSIKSSYLRIWKRETGGSWKLALEITNPIPEKKE
jgi:ketosteroid isomerase-like protein